MPKKIPEESLSLLEDLLQQYPDGLSAREILAALPHPPPHRTLQYHLKFLVDRYRIEMEGEGRSARYVKYSATPAADIPSDDFQKDGDVRIHALAISKSGREIQNYVNQPQHLRRPVGYNRQFLESYRPNHTCYLSQEQQDHLHMTGSTPDVKGQQSGTYAKKILSRLLIDLSWNSSRLEGNTYSILDTIRLIEEGIEAKGKSMLETQMILNHKSAIEFLVDAVEVIGFNRYTVLNLHGILADKLLQDSMSVGRLRRIDVGIGGSVYFPLAIPQQVEECFDQLLQSASEINDPFEQSFFVLAQLPYLQPFDDVNKRVSRLCVNIPLIKANLVPICFEDVPREIYIEALLGVYELNKLDLLRDIFLFAYERSVVRYAAIRQTVGEPDPFQMIYRTEFREVVTTVIRVKMNKSQAAEYINSWTQSHIPQQDQEKFRNLAERELLNFHIGNIARYQITPTEFSEWTDVWGD